MRFPEFIKRGDTIGFVSPAFSAANEPYRSAFNNSLKFWEGRGYYVNLGPNTYVDQGIGICNTPEKCGEELTEYYVNHDANALISCGGGELMCESISYVDFDAVRSANPKWFMGYSDNTNFAFLLTTICDVASIYGPNASSFGMEKIHKSLLDAYAVLSGECLKVRNYDKYETESLKSEDNPLASYNCTNNVCIKGFIPTSEKDSTGYKEVMSTDTISFSGRIIGGCMDCLGNIVGTEYDYVNQFVEKYKDDGIIWYLEACDYNVFDIRRQMWQFMHAGWFKYTKGFIFGRPLNGEDMFNLNRFDAVLPYASSQCNVPVIMDADIGHLPPMMPLVNGAMADVTYRGGELSVDMRLT